MNEIAFKAIRQLRHHLFSLSNPGYIVVDQQFNVLGTTGDLHYYKLENLKENDDASNYLPCLIGIDTKETTQIPFYHIEDKICHIIVMPVDNNLAILLMDATEAHWQQQHEQQKANENSLLKDKLEVLTSELQTAQIELEEKNKKLEEEDRLKANFIANMSHEFRTPLTAILGYTQILRKDFENEDHRLEKISAIERGGKYLLSLVENLLDQMRMEISEIDIHETPTNIKTLIDDLAIIFMPLARKKDLDFKVNALITEDVNLMLDELRLRQVLINIIGNSIKFTNSGKITLTSRYEKGFLTLSVEDTGVGIAESNIEKILKPFIRVDESEKGVGLGLSISNHLINAMHGTLEIKSKQGSGSCFTIRLKPRPYVTSFDSSNSTSISTTIEEQISILIAEDDDDLSELYRQLLESENVKIVRAITGHEAVDLAKSHNPDLIIIDLHMPVMGGKEATIKIRQQGYSNPILAISAATSYSARSEAIAAGCNGYIVKPIGLQNLLVTINAYLNIKKKNPISNESFEVLQRTFRNSLDERLEELEIYYKQISEARMYGSDRSRLQKLVHRLSGTASFFQLGQIGSDAEYLEDHLNKIIDEDINQNVRVSEYLDRLIRSIKRETKI